MEKTEIISGIYAIGPALWISRGKILIIGDVHLGYEDTLEKQGFILPRSQFKESVEIMKYVFKEVGKAELIVINGDLKHEFGRISDQEWLDTSRFLDLLSKNCKELLLIKGNHDTVLGPIAKKKNLEVKKYLTFKLNKGEEIEIKEKSFLRKKIRRIKAITILHGDKIIEEKSVKDSDLLVIGHDHPAVLLEEGVKKEKYKCFLFGNYKKQKIIVMPSFLPGIEGVNVKQRELLSPYLDQDLDDFEVFIVGDKIYKFGKLKNL